MNTGGLSVWPVIYATMSDLAAERTIVVQKQRLLFGHLATNLCSRSMDKHQIDPAHPLGSRGTRKRASIVVLDPSPISLLALAGVLDSQGYGCVCARDGKSAVEALAMGLQDLVVCDVGDDAAAALETIQQMRSTAGYEQLPALLLAESRWSGLEKKAEAMKQPTRCLFKPIDPNSMIAVVDQVLWMPSLVDSHRRRGSTPNRPGWVTLE